MAGFHRTCKFIYTSALNFLTEKSCYNAAL